MMIVAHELGLAGNIELPSMQATKPPAG